MSFGYQVLGFGSGGAGAKFYEATGGTITEDGSFKVHTFTSSGTFEITQIPADTSASVSYTHLTLPTILLV